MIAAPSSAVRLRRAIDGTDQHQSHAKLGFSIFCSNFNFAHVSFYWSFLLLEALEAKTANSPIRNNGSVFGPGTVLIDPVTLFSK